MATKEQESQLEESTEGEKLLARGVEVELGGAKVPLRFGNPAVVELERKWGSIKALGEELEKGFDGKLFTVVSDIICACLRGSELPIDPIELIEPSQIAEYIPAIFAALEQAGFVSTNGAARGNAGGPKTGRSRGATSSTRRSSGSESRRRPSGP